MIVFLLVVELGWELVLIEVKVVYILVILIDCGVDVKDLLLYVMMIGFDFFEEGWCVGYWLEECYKNDVGLINIVEL